MTTELNADMFNFDAMKEKSGDPFKEESTYVTDERFYTLAKDKEGNGGAIVRFLPDVESAMIQRMFKCNSNHVVNGKKRFVSVFSPQTIGLPDPFQNKWEELWNADQKEEAKKFSRGVTFIANIKIIKDPATPENEGKIFLYQMSGAIKDKIQMAMTPSEQDVALGAAPKQMFNPMKGHNFKLSCKKGENDQITYGSSEIKPEITSIYGDDVQACLDDIKANTHTLSGLLKPDQFLSFEELEKKLLWVQGLDKVAPPKINTLEQSVTPVETVVETKPVEPVETVVETKPVETVVETKPVETVVETKPVESAGAPSIDSLLEDL